MNKNETPYILINKYTYNLFIILLILIIYFSITIYKFDLEMLEIRKQNFNNIHKSKNIKNIFKQCDKHDIEFINSYIYYIIDKKEYESNKFEKIIDSLSNGFFTGFIASSLSGNRLINNFITGLTFGVTNALYKSIYYYKLYKKKSY